jgi:hypothetical protein
MVVACLQLNLGVRQTQGYPIILCSFTEPANTRALLLAWGLLFVTPDVALAQASVGAATIRLNGAVAGTWSARAHYEFTTPSLLTIYIADDSKTCCTVIQMRRSGNAPLRPGSYRIVVGPSYTPRPDTTVFQTIVQLPHVSFNADTATGTIVIESADALWASGRVAFKLFRRGRPLLPPGADTLRVEATFKAVNEREEYRRAIASLPVTDDDNPPEAVLGATLGGSRRALKEYLAGLAWRQVFDTLGGTGPVVVYSGAIDGHKAEIVAMFGYYSPDRLINFFVAFPAGTPEELRATYLWAYRFMDRRRCDAVISAEDRQKLNRIIAAPTVTPLPMEHRMGIPVGPGHAVIDLGNLLWPKPTWLAADGLSGVQLSASALPGDAAWPYQVTLWSGKILASRGRRCH